MALTDRPSSPSLRNVTATIFFMRREDRHRREKPYILRFVADAPLPPDNFIYDPCEGIKVTDMRDHLHRFTIEENGFAIWKMSNKMSYEEYHNIQGLKRYFKILEVTLKEHLGASRVEVFRHNIRKRHSEFPIATGTTYAFDQPTSVAHVDTTAEGALKELMKYTGHQSDKVSWKRVQWFNVWKPLRGPLNDWPLALCDTKSVNVERDYECTDILFEDFVAENYQCHYHPDQRWYYLRDHQEDELIVFKQSDTDPASSPGVLHSSFFNPFTDKDEPPRESIEVRLFAYYS